MGYSKGGVEVKEYLHVIKAAQVSVEDFHSREKSIWGQNRSLPFEWSEGPCQNTG